MTACGQSILLPCCHPSNPCFVASFLPWLPCCDHLPSNSTLCYLAKHAAPLPSAALAALVALCCDCCFVLHLLLCTCCVLLCACCIVLAALHLLHRTCCLPHSVLRVLPCCSTVICYTCCPCWFMLRLLVSVCTAVCTGAFAAACAATATAAVAAATALSMTATLPEWQRCRLYCNAAIPMPSLCHCVVGFLKSDWNSVDR